MATKINTPHNRFFKTMMAKPDVSREFLIANLPSHIQDIIDLDTIKFHKESFIDQQLKLILSAIHRIGDMDSFLTITYYLMVTRKIDIQDAYNITDEIGISKDYKEELVTLADKLRQEGRQEDIREGRQEERLRAQREKAKLIKNLLAAGMSIEQVAMATKMTFNEVEQLALRDV